MDNARLEFTTQFSSDAAQFSSFIGDRVRALRSTADSVSAWGHTPDASTYSRVRWLGFTKIAIVNVAAPRGWPTLVGRCICGWSMAATAANGVQILVVGTPASPLPRCRCHASCVGADSSPAFIRTNDSAHCRRCCGASVASTSQCNGVVVVLTMVLNRLRGG